MRFLFTADIHLSRYGQDRIVSKTGLPERLTSLSHTLDEMADYCLANEISTFVIGGDSLHGKSIIYAIAQDILLSFFDKYSNLQFIVIDGNHDLSGRGSDVVSALLPLKNIDNVLWIPFNETYRDQQNNILYIPYSTDMVKKIVSSEARILISHIGLNEAVLSSGISVISSLSVKDLLGKYQLVLLGHYHKPQEIISENISVYYVGSPIQLDWGEKNEQKRFLVVDTETLQVESVPTTQYKRYVELEITNDNKNEVLKEASELRKDGHNVKVVMREKVELDKQIEGVNIVDRTEKDITNRGITSSMSEEDKLRRYLDIKEIEETKHEMYLKPVIELIQTAEVI